MLINFDQEDIGVHGENLDRKLRSSGKIKLRYTFSSLLKVHKRLYYRGVEAWNELPELS